MAVPLPTYVPRWASLAPWVASTYVIAGERVTNDGGKIYQCITSGNTGNAGGPTGMGADIPDPGAGAPVAHWMYIGINAPAYAPGVYNVGDRVTNTGNIYQVTKAPGAASSIAPTGLGPGPLFTADNYVWQFLISASAVRAVPTDGQADTGWLPGQYPPSQVMNQLLWGIYRWIVWLKDLPNQSITWLAAQTWNALGTFAGGIVVTQSTVNGDAIQATSNGNGFGGKFVATGTAPAVRGVNTTAVGVEGYGGQQGVLGHGNAGAAIGVEGKADPITGTGAGVKGTGGGTSGMGGLFAAIGGNSSGVEATPHGAGSGVLANASAGTGYGVEILPNATKAAINLGSGIIADPAAVEGSIYYNSNTGKFRGYNGITAAWEDLN